MVGEEDEVWSRVSNWFVHIWGVRVQGSLTQLRGGVEMISI